MKIVCVQEIDFNFRSIGIKGTDVMKIKNLKGDCAMKQKEWFLKIFVITIFSLVLVQQTAGGVLNINQTNETADTVSISISIVSAGNKVTALGFDLQFDPSVLEYVQFERGQLIVNGFIFFDVGELGNGTLRIGGFESGNNAIDAGQSGDIVLLTFNVLQCKNSQLSLLNLVDDFQIWNTEDMQFTCVDDSDSCPDDPVKIDPGICGCGVSDMDTEGIPDIYEVDETVDLDADGISDLVRSKYCF